LRTAHAHSKQGIIALIHCTIHEKAMKLTKRQTLWKEFNKAHHTNSDRSEKEWYQNPNKEVLHDELIQNLSEGLFKKGTDIHGTPAEQTSLYL